jgi:MFS transporter, ACS family, hexuronate transporter
MRRGAFASVQKPRTAKPSWLADLPRDRPLIFMHDNPRGTPHTLTMANPTSPAPSPSVGNYRWRVLAMLFAATTINYMDRSVLGVLAPTLQYKVFHWTDQDYATITNFFNVAYAIGMVSMGAIIDKFGTKIGYTLAISIWSLAGMSMATIRPAFGVLGFSLSRFTLGLGESGNFPAAIKTVAEWFPKQQRAFATGIFNSGSNVGAILAPTIIPLVVWPDGTHWQWAFLTTGVFSAIWVVVWLKIYQRPEVHPKVSPQELAYINSDSVPETAGNKIPWSRVLPLRETWAFALAKMTDAVWWFYLFWAGKYFYDRYGLNIKGLAVPLITMYAVADVGSIWGGWMSSHFIKKGWSVNRARKTTMLICALCIMPVMFSTQLPTRFVLNDRFFERLQTTTFTSQKNLTPDGKPAQETVPAEVQAALHSLKDKSYDSAKEFMTAVGVVITPAEASREDSVLINSARSDNYYWLAVVLISIALGGHQAWSANLFTLVSDVFPKKATASVIGIGGMMGSLAGIVATFSLGQVLTTSGPSGYFFAFMIAGSAYLILLGVAHLLMPKMTPLDENLRHVVE